MSPSVWIVLIPLFCGGDEGGLKGPPTDLDHKLWIDVFLSNGRLEIL